MECGASFGELLDLVHDVRIVIIVIYNPLCSSKLFLLVTIAKLHFQILASGQSYGAWVTFVFSVVDWD